MMLTTLRSRVTEIKNYSLGNKAGKLNQCYNRNRYKVPLVYEERVANSAEKGKIDMD